MRFHSLTAIVRRKDLLTPLTNNALKERVRLPVRMALMGWSKLRSRMSLTFLIQLLRVFILPHSSREDMYGGPQQGFFVQSIQQVTNITLSPDLNGGQPNCVAYVPHV